MTLLFPLGLTLLVYCTHCTYAHDDEWKEIHEEQALIEAQASTHGVVSGPGKCVDKQMQSDKGSFVLSTPANKLGAAGTLTYAKNKPFHFYGVKLSGFGVAMSTEDNTVAGKTIPQFIADLDVNWNHCGCGFCTGGQLTWCKEPTNTDEDSRQFKLSRMFNDEKQMSTEAAGWSMKEFDRAGNKVQDLFECDSPKCIASALPWEIIGEKWKKWTGAESGSVAGYCEGSMECVWFYHDKCEVGKPGNLLEVESEYVDTY